VYGTKALCAPLQIFRRRHCASYPGPDRRHGRNPPRLAMSVSGGDPVGFTIGMMIGFAWIVWSGPHRGRGAGAGMYLFMLLCGVIGWGVELAFQWSADTACHQARGLAMPVPIPAIGAVAGFFGAFVVQVRGLAFDSVSAGARMLFFMFLGGWGGLWAGVALQSIAGEICRHWH
jgi:hypothetical protein